MKTKAKTLMLSLFIFTSLFFYGQNDSSGLKPGSISQNAVVLDAEQLFPIYEGAAIIKKGNSTALIDTKGMYLAPYNKYEFDYNKSKNGFFLINKEYMFSGFMNGKGEYYDVPYKSAVTPEIIGNYIRIKDFSDRSGSTYHFIDKSGKKHIITELQNADFYGKITDGLIPFQNGYKHGFKNLENKIIINAIYDDIFNFSEGLAAVGIKDEFGKIKYGFIDTNGKLAIPLQFSQKPSDFKEGISTVFYNDYRTYSFIDKTGKVIYTNDKEQYGPLYNGYSIKQNGKVAIMDSRSNKIMSPDELMKEFGIKENMRSISLGLPQYYNSRSDANNPYYFNKSSKIKFSFLPDNGNIVTGYLDTKNKKAFYGTFNSSALRPDDNKFDNVSNLALATYQKSNTYGDVIEGYIDENGVFVMVKGEKSKW
mgnify:CR=1 FL=1|tara:strand:+ start:14741 stop:16006 length:1266 start_codon:yes stop_codon:yes gene_type:complete